MDKKITYKDAGVDINASNKFVKSLKSIIKPSMRPEVMSDIGGFGGFFALNKNKYKDPVLVASTDGVGTKLKIAFMMNRHDTIGIDLVAMCVNDIIVQGAEPLFMLDYISIGQFDENILTEVVKGIVQGCKQSGCALIGGETAEMPSFYGDSEYDIAGFVVGVVEKDEVIDGSSITASDRIIGIASSGVHSNGLSLARKVMFDEMGLKHGDFVDSLGCTAGEELLKPTKIYVKTILNLLRDFQIHGIAHITGGGLVDNISRILPKSCMANIQMGCWDIPPVFKCIQEGGGVDDEEMLRTFNNGIGMVLVVRAEDEEDIMLRLDALKEKAFVIGKIESKDRRKKKDIKFTDL